MNIIITAALSGGLFAMFSFIHFFVDFIFQSHSEAMVKHNNPKIRAKHCIIYTIGFIPLMLILKFSTLEFILGINILFWSHFYLDTYHGVYLWAKYIRKPPEMTSPITINDPCGLMKTQVLPPDPKAGFVKFIQTPLGKILMIAIDQISHLTFLWPLVYMALN